MDTFIYGNNVKVVTDKGMTKRSKKDLSYHHKLLSNTGKKIENISIKVVDNINKCTKNIENIYVMNFCLSIASLVDLKSHKCQCTQYHKLSFLKLFKDDTFTKCSLRSFTIFQDFKCRHNWKSSF